MKRALLILIAGSFNCWSSSYSFEDLDFLPTAINDQGAIVGYGDTVIFVRHNGVTRTISAPEGTSISPTGIANDGTIVGNIFRPVNPYGVWETEGFTVRDGVMSLVIFPDALNTMIGGISNSGVLVGTAQMHTSTSETLMFTLENDSFRRVYYPGASLLSAFQPSDIDTAGTIVGSYFEFPDTRYGFILGYGNLSRIPVPDFEGVLSGPAMNDMGVIAGSRFLAVQGRSTGFVFRNGNVENVDVPESAGTRILDINNSGQLVGYYYRSGGVHGFVATPEPVPEPTTFALTAGAILGLYYRKTRKAPAPLPEI